MAQIHDGQQYALRSQNQSKAGNGCSIMLVKLTDSALRSLDDHAALLQKGVLSPNAKLSIKLDSDGGVIVIPGKDVSTSPSRFNFAIKELQNGDGIVHGIRQSAHHPEQMDVLGQIMSRMQIQAGEESFENTKVKISVAAEQELNKYNTKTLSNDFRNKNKVQPNSLKKTVYSKANGVATGSSMPRFGSAAPNRLSTGVGALGSKPSLGGQPLTPPAPLSDSSRKIIREHLIHLLAVRPMKLGEIHAKVADKVKEKQLDKASLMSVVTTVAHLRDGAYHLNEPVWEEVKLEWTHYTRDDRDCVMKRNPLLHPPSARGSGSTSISPTSHGFTDMQHRHSSPHSLAGSGNSNSSPPLLSGRIKTQPVAASASSAQSNAPKRNLNVPELSPNLNPSDAKRPKPSVPTLHHGNSNSPKTLSPQLVNSSSNNVPRSTTTTNNIPPYPNYPASNCYKNAALRHNNTSSVVSHGNTNTTRSNSSRQTLSTNGHTSGNGRGSINSTPNSSPDSGISHIGKIGSDDETDEFSSIYPEITNIQKLQEYRQEYYKNFDECNRLLKYTQEVNKQFEGMRNKFISVSESSPEYNKLSQKIVERYQKILNPESDYAKADKRISHLFKLLNHLRKCCVDFVDRNPNNDFMGLINSQPFHRAQQTA